MRFRGPASYAACSCDLSRGQIVGFEGYRMCVAIPRSA
jgi:hypothetical protein